MDIKDYDIDVLEGLEAAVMTAPSLLAAVKEARAWQEMIATNQVGMKKNTE